MGDKKKQQGKKARKVGRNMIKCKRYLSEGRRERNKARRAKHLAKKYAKNKQRRAAEEGSLPDEPHQDRGLPGTSPGGIKPASGG